MWCCVSSIGATGLVQMQSGMQSPGPAWAWETGAAVNEMPGELIHSDVREALRSVPTSEPIGVPGELAQLPQTWGSAPKL